MTSRPPFRHSHLPGYRPPYGPGPLNGHPDARPRPMAKDNPKPAKAAAQPSLAAARGRKLGEAFARLSRPRITADDINRATSFQDAITRGREESAADAARMQELMNDADELQAMGFTAFGGRSYDE